MKNPQLYYKDHVVREMHAVWKHQVDFPTVEEDEDSKTHPTEVVVDSKMLSITEVPDLKNLLYTEAMLSIHDEEQREEILSQLNKGILDLSFPLEETQPDLLYQTCLQLWREAIDGLVNHSILLRSILGLPEKESLGEVVQEEEVELRRASKVGREDKKGGGLKEEKKNTGSREKGATKPPGKDRSLEKEDRPVSRKTKGKEDKRGVRMTRDFKDLTASTDSLDHLAPEHKLQQPDPAVQAEYQEKLYTQVYQLLVSLVENLVYLSEGLKNETVLTEEEEVELYM